VANVVRALTLGGGGNDADAGTGGDHSECCLDLVNLLTMGEADAEFAEQIEDFVGETRPR
jgi:hypothetical protein